MVFKDKVWILQQAAAGYCWQQLRYAGSQLEVVPKPCLAFLMFKLQGLLDGSFELRVGYVGW
jgi:hypothetical protein